MNKKALPFFYIFFYSAHFYSQIFNTYLVADDTNHLYKELQAVVTHEGTLLSAIYYDEPGIGSRVQVMRSTDNGVTWIQTFLLDSVNYYYDPSIDVADDNAIYLTCMRSTANTVVPIYASVDDGINFKYTGLAVQEGESILPDKPMVLCDEANTFLTYTDIGLGGVNYITNKTSTDDTYTWPSVYAFNDVEENSNGGSWLTKGFDNKLITSFSDLNTGKIDIRISEDGGITYGDVQQIENNPAPGYFEVTQLIAEPYSEYLGVLINSAHNAKPLLYTFTKNAGTTWQTTEIDDAAITPAAYLNATDGKLHVIYSHINGAEFTFHYTTSIDSGATFNFDTILAEGPIDALFLAVGEYQTILKGADAKLHATWIDFSESSVLHTVIDIGEIPIDTTGDTTVIDTTNFIPDYLIANIQLAPNPVHDVLYLTSNIPAGVYEISLHSIYGTLLKKEKRNMQTKENFSVSEFPAGIYFLVIQQNNAVYAHTFIKQ